jgi:hypothetical protein
VAAKVALAKLDRDQESAADRLGLVLAAQAGYHPAFGILAARILREKLGAQSNFGAFFADHPRWTTREERIDRNYSEALAAFNQSWPDAASSPGGFLPAELLQGRPTAATAAPALRLGPGVGAPVGSCGPPPDCRRPVSRWDQAIRRRDRPESQRESICRAGQCVLPPRLVSAGDTGLRGRNGA